MSSPRSHTSGPAKAASSKPGDASPPPARAARRVPTPLVVAMASVLLSTGVVALVVSQLDDAPPPAPPATNEPAPGTPEATALAFVNAWTTFRYERARELSTGDARSRVDQTLARESGYSDDQREIAEQLRKAMQTLRCVLGSHAEERVDDGRTIVRATIRCTGAGSAEFERDDVYTVLRVDGGWRVAAWEPGTRRSL
ncbi:MAG: hypothetical protein IT379_38800 [Deltaproteobacteria bacterium]|nr:hypothetical protein [Deltaproteobacteria bacterium]